MATLLNSSSAIAAGNIAPESIQGSGETPERAGGRTKINSDCDQFQV